MDGDGDTCGVFRFFCPSWLSFPKQDYTQYRQMYCVVFLFFTSFLPAHSLLSQRLRREEAKGEEGGGGRVPLCLGRAPFPVQLT